MKILQVNKFYYLKGGSEAYLFGLENELVKLGHKVAQFSMTHPQNRQNQWEGYFVKQIDYNNTCLTDNIVNAGKIIYSYEARKKIEQLIKKFKPDIAHLHMFQHQLSPSILFALKQYNVPVIYTAHDLKAICPNYKMLRKGKVCEKCKDHKYYHCFLGKCTKNSHLKSLINTFEMYCHTFLRIQDMFDIVVTPSKFYKKKFLEFGFKPEKVIFVSNFVDTKQIIPSYNYGEYFVYCGRLAEEKGLFTLIKAMKGVKQGKLIIIGSGPLASDLKNLIKKLHLNNVEMKGFLIGEELIELVSNCLFTVLPSQWYENGPMAIIESFAYGKPVLGANIGGIPEHITPGQDGLIFKSSDSKDLTKKINTLFEITKNDKGMARNAREKAKKLYSKEVHMKKILDLYRSLTGTE